MPLIIGANSVSGYEVDNSLRFNSGSSDNLSRTPSVTGNTKTWTFSCWVKRANLSSNQVLLGARPSGSDPSVTIRFNTDDTLVFQKTGGASSTQNLTTSQLFRDVSAWYHILIVCDTTQATSTNRVKVYVNGQQVTSFSSSGYPNQNEDLVINNSSYPHFLSLNNGFGQYFNGYMSEVYLIDGQALTSSSFGETDAASGIWKPIPYTGTFGTNGFYLEFQDSSALGDDTSGNGNDWTVNNLTSIDQSTDTPTNNFCTLNSLDAMKTNGAVVSEGNLKSLGSTASGIGAVTGTISVSQGKWYWEVSRVGTGNYAYVGVVEAGIGNETNITGYGISGYRSNGDTYVPAQSILASWNTAGDIIMIAMDMDNGAIYYGKNGTFLNSGVPTSGASKTGALSTFTPSTTAYAPLAGGFDTSNGVNCNFGSPPFTISSGNADADGFGNFEYAVPSGYFALCTKNLAQYG
jgi:hypothetical protein